MGKQQKKSNVNGLFSRWPTTTNRMNGQEHSQFICFCTVNFIRSKDLPSKHLNFMTFMWMERVKLPIWKFTSMEKGNEKTKWLFTLYTVTVWSYIWKQFKLHKHVPTLAFKITLFVTPMEFLRKMNKKKKFYQALMDGCSFFGGLDYGVETEGVHNHIIKEKTTKLFICVTQFMCELYGIQMFEEEKPEKQCLKSHFNLTNTSFISIVLFSMKWVSYYLKVNWAQDSEKKASIIYSGRIFSEISLPLNLRDQSWKYKVPKNREHHNHKINFLSPKCPMYLRNNLFSRILQFHIPRMYSYWKFWENKRFIAVSQRRP